MSKKVYDLTNKKFGRLTVLYRVEDRISPTNGRKHAMWHCKCECGNEIDALGWQLTGGSKYKCGTNCGFGVYKKDEKGNMKMATGGYLKGGLVDHEINKLWNTNLSDSNAMIKVKAKCELLVDLEIISRDQADNILNTLSAKEETFLWRNRDTYCSCGHLHGIKTGFEDDCGYWDVCLDCGKRLENTHHFYEQKTEDIRESELSLESNVDISNEIKDGNINCVKNNENNI